MTAEKKAREVRRNLRRGPVRILGVDEIFAFKTDVSGVNIDNLLIIWINNLFLLIFIATTI
jgi:hypothetical protein